MIVSRRKLMSAAPAVALAPLALGACSSFDLTATGVANDFSTVVAGLEGIVGQIGVAVPAAVTSAITALKALVSSVAATASTVAQQPLIAQAQAYIGSVLSTLLSLGGMLPSVVTTVLSAVSALWPVIESAVGIVVAAMALPPGSMTPATARLVLKAAAPH